MYNKVGLLQYTVVGTPCRQSSAENEFQQTRRLARLGWATWSLREAALGNLRGPAIYNPTHLPGWHKRVHIT
jgi:hypothetical protein